MTFETQITTKFGFPLSTPGSEWTYTCPTCEKPKLYANIDTGFYFCQVCEKGGSVKHRVFDKVLVNPFLARSMKGKDIITPPTLDSIEATLVESGSEVSNYLICRGITEKEIKSFKIMESDYFGYQNLAVYSASGKYKYMVKKYLNVTGSAIFPIYDGGYRGFQIRYVRPRLIHGKPQRWISCPGLFRKYVLFNADTALTLPVAFIAEGIPAAAAFGRAGIATFGKAISDYQIQRMAKSTVKRFYIAYDGGTEKECSKLMLPLIEAGKEVYRIEFSGEEDPDSVSDLQLRIKEAKRFTAGKALTYKYKNFNLRKAFFYK